jgi:hypothetical protein
VPASGRGRAFLVERELKRDGNAALYALVADYVQQCRRLDAIPMGENILSRYVAALES